MAILNTISFETGTVAELFGPAGTYSVVTSPVRNNTTYSLRVNPTTTGTGGGYLYGAGGGGFNIATGYATFYFRYATRPASSDEPIATSIAAGNPLKMELRINSSGNLAVYDSTSTLVATGTTVLAANTWYRIDLRSGNGTSAAYEIRIDGVTELSGTCNQGATNFNQVAIGKYFNRNGQTVDFYYSTCRVDDAAFATSDFAQKLIFPNADGSQTDWTGDYTNVNTWSTTDDVSYIATTTQNAKELFTKSSLSSNGVSGTINAIKVLESARRSAQPTAFAILILSGATEAQSANIAPGTSYAAYAYVRTTDPATSVTWTTSGVDNLEIGAIFLNAQAREVRITSVAILIDYTPPTGVPLSFGYIIW